MRGEDAWCRLSEVSAYASMPFDLFHAPVVWKRHVGRLGLVGSTAVPTGRPTPMTCDAAVDRLVAEGLFCKKTSEMRLHIMGGIGTFLERGVSGYESPFAILEEQDGTLTAMVSGTQRCPDEEACVDDLAGAVTFVLGVYRARGLLAASGGQR